VIAKMTSKSQITIPRAISKQFDSLYFDVRKEGEKIVLVPVNLDSAEQARVKLEEMGISERDIEDAVAWARR
jgi:bifunctional DNA-binding transcriptional regulator/antitoxin component of YhaV-PrlF toxin-antitoxin module